MRILLIETPFVRLLLAGVLCASMQSCPALAATPEAHPYLLRDINLSLAEPVLQILGGAPNLLFFASDDGTNGVELWKTDGTPSGTRLIKDIYPGMVGSFPSRVAVAGNIIFFVADDGINGMELWKTDGSAEGTHLVKDINPGNSGSFPYRLRDVNGMLFFVAQDGMHGPELWKSDGTSNGTTLVTDIRPGDLSSFPSDLVNVNGLLFFTADDGTHGVELWKSDGTASGTQLVRDINTGPSDAYPAYLVNMNGTLFFAADDGSNGIELWGSDGSVEGTRLVADINRGTSGSFLQSLVSVGGTLFFTADDGVNGIELWKSDGTANGTQLVKDIWAGGAWSFPDNFVGANGILFFAADDGINGKELWKSDGSSGGTVLVRDIEPGRFGALPAELVSANGTVYFVATAGTNGPQIWRSDGTSNGTTVVHALSASPGTFSSPQLTNLLGEIVFTANLGDGKSLWKSDSTTATSLFKPLSLGTRNSLENIFQTVRIGATTFFAADDGIHGVELWKTDGSPGNATMVKDIFPGANGSFPNAFFQEMVSANGILFFPATDGTNGPELWQSDGTASGTFQTGLSRPGAEGTFPQGLVNVNDYVCYTTADASFTRRLRYTKASTGITTEPGGDDYIEPLGLCRFGDRLFFMARWYQWQGNPNNVIRRLFRLSLLDLNSGDRSQIREINFPVSSSGIFGWATNVNNRLFFSIEDGNGIELWTSMGSSGSTVQLGINPGAESSWPSPPVFVNGLYYFSAFHQSSGYELWVTDGTPENTRLVRDIYPGPLGSFPNSFCELNGELYFSAQDAEGGRELWRSTGSADGTRRVKDIEPGAGGSNPSALVTVGNRLFFAADASSGIELWMSDGTESGTRLVTDLEPGSNSAFPSGLREFNGSLLFAASSYLHGREPWMVVPEYAPGDEIAIPQAALSTRDHAYIPTVVPSSGVCWDQEEHKLLLQLPGYYRITWRDAATNDYPTIVHVRDIPVTSVSLAEEILPPPNFNSAAMPAIGPEIIPPGMALWSIFQRKLYAIAPGNFTVIWKEDACKQASQAVVAFWPTNDSAYQTFVSGDAPIILTNWGVNSVTKLLSQDPGVGANVELLEAEHAFVASGVGRSLLLLSPGDPAQTNIFFQFARAITWNDSSALEERTATIGQAIQVPRLGDEDTFGVPILLNSRSRYCTNFYDPASRSGVLIPVNRDDPDTVDDDMVLIAYQRGAKLYDPLTGRLTNSNIGWPYRAVRYDCQWPTNVSEIVLASGQGSAPQSSDGFRDPAIYVQNDPSLPGFNPNDEHAWLQVSGSNATIYALRDDLGANNSEPYVLVTHHDAENRPAIRVFQVVAQEGPSRFDNPEIYFGETGKEILAPNSLLLRKGLQSVNWSKDYAVTNLSLFEQTFFKDRRNRHWAKAAGDDGGSATLTMRYWYPTRADFYFPSSYFVHFPAEVLHTNVPPEGTLFPWLDLRAATPGTPHDVTYTIDWPSDVEQLDLAQTLVAGTEQRNSTVLGAKSVDVIYQQSVALGQGPSVKLFDPTAPVVVTNVNLPEGLTDSENNRRVFPAVPTSLRSRTWYDSLGATLNLSGQLFDSTQEPLLLLNVLNARDVRTLYQANGNADYSNAVARLAAQAAVAHEVFPEQPFYTPLALHAGVGLRSGYVTLTLNNSTNLLSIAELDQLPVQLQLFRITNRLHVGDIKAVRTIYDSPVADRLTLRFNGDFAGRADDYFFEWRYHQNSSAPVTEWRPFTVPVHPNAPPTGEEPGRGAVEITIEGPGPLTLADHYFICRYRPATLANLHQNWSNWTPPRLAEGWIKRATSGLNLFEQRFKDLRDRVDTRFTVMSQVGKPWNGQVPFNREAVERAGLIELYTTILRRGIDLSLEGTPRLAYDPIGNANIYNALLLAASRLSELYMLLGNEAVADAADPTIGIGADQTSAPLFVPTSMFSFQNQVDVPNLLTEELSLLRGRGELAGGNSLAFYPVFNRLFWNFKSGGEGEVAYVNNYNIRVRGSTKQRLHESRCGIRVSPRPWRCVGPLPERGQGVLPVAAINKFRMGPRRMRRSRCRACLIFMWITSTNGSSQQQQPPRLRPVRRSPRSLIVTATSRTRTDSGRATWISIPTERGARRSGRAVLEREPFTIGLRATPCYRHRTPTPPPGMWTEAQCLNWAN